MLKKKKRLLDLKLFTISAIVIGNLATPALASENINSENQAYLNNISLEELEDADNLLNSNKVEIKLNEKIIRTYTTNGNDYTVEIFSYESDEAGNPVANKRWSSSAKTVEEGKTYTTTITYNNIDKILGGKIVTKTTYKINKITNGLVSDIKGTNASITATPPQTYSISSSSFDFTLSTGYDLAAEGHVSLKASLADVNLNYYPKTWIYGKGTSTNQIWVCYELSN
ncbi:MAG: hypothetical protein Q4D26_04150 [Clostridia bacterium]|nr:hypothetical protein [Clostridia bacterium]